MHSSKPEMHRCTSLSTTALEHVADASTQLELVEEDDEESESDESEESELSDEVEEVADSSVDFCNNIYCSYYFSFISIHFS